MSVGANIKKRRFELKMSQQELADAMGYKTRSTIAKIESGENDVSQGKLERFAHVLDTTVDYFISGREKGIDQPIPATVIAPYSELNTNSFKTAAVILAGGKSSRNQQNIPNQFVEILGKPVIVYCLLAYQNHPAIDDIYIVCLKGWENIVLAYAEQYGISKLRNIIPGAKTGIASVKTALDNVKSNYKDSDVIIFQESTRPMINTGMISNLLSKCEEYGSANICQHMKDYLQFIESENSVTPIDRTLTIECQSPEAHRFSNIKSVFNIAQKKQHELKESCTAMLMYNLGIKVNFVDGNVRNLKIIRQEDINIVASLLRNVKL